MRYKKWVMKLILMKFYFTSPNLAPINFLSFRGPLNIYNKIKKGNISIKKTEEDQKKFNSNLSKITTGNPKYRKEDRLNTIKNIKNLYNKREKVIKWFNDYAKIKSEAIYKTKHGRGLKI